MTRKFNRGEIWLADLNPRSGTEPGKVRPVLVIQNQALLDASHPSTLIIPLTTHLVEDAEPLRLRLIKKGGVERDSDLLIDQICAIDNVRLLRGPLLQCGPRFMHRVMTAVLETMGFTLPRSSSREG